RVSRRCPLQQDHEPIFKPCWHRGDSETHSRVVLWEVATTRAVLRTDEAHASTFWHCINDVRGIEQTCLEMARLLPGGVRRQERSAGYYVCDVRGYPLRQHLALMQDEVMPAALGFIQIGGTEQHSKALLLHQMKNDPPKLPP